MILGFVIRDFYIDAWKRIPDIVAAMNDDEARIRENSALAPTQTSLERAVTAAGFPSILVAYQGYTKGDSRRAEITKHHIAAFIRAATQDDDDHITLAHLMTEAVPNGEELTVRYMESDPDCDSMDLPKLERITLTESAIDIWKLSFAVPEHAG
jgi:hypothetical protein